MDENLLRLLFSAFSAPGPRNASSPQAFMDPEAIVDTVSPRGPLSGLERRYGILPPVDPHSQPGAVVPPQFSFSARLPLAPLLQHLPQNVMFDILRALNPQLGFGVQTPNPWTLPDATAGFQVRRQW